jgi:hypothetical protein
VNQKKLNILKHFLGFCKKELEIQSLPKISLIKGKSFVENFRSFGEYNPNDMSIRVFVTGRNLADICRSLAHELVHHRQNELDLIYNAAGETGTEIENDANAIAGILMREYGKLNLSVYELDILAENLEEAKQVGTLYHFTSYGGFNSILKDNLVLKTHQMDIQPYVSFTRDKHFKSDTISTQVRIVIDGNKLSEKYKVSPHADIKAGYGRKSRDEAEERISLVKYPQGVDIKKSLIRVDIKKFDTSIDWDDPETFQDSEDFVEPPSLEMYNTMLNSLKKTNIPYQIVSKF